MNLKDIKTEDLINELESRGAERSTFKLYANGRCFICTKLTEVCKEVSREDWNKDKSFTVYKI